MDNFLGKSKLNFRTKNEDFEQCDKLTTYLLLLVSCLAMSRNISSTPSPVLHDVLYTPDTKFRHCSQNPSMSASVTCILDLRSNLFPHLNRKEKYVQPFDRYRVSQQDLDRNLAKNLKILRKSKNVVKVCLHSSADLLSIWRFFFLLTLLT